MIFPLVCDLAADETSPVPVAVTCWVLGVCRSGCYEWRERPASPRAVADTALTQTIAKVHASSRATYGAPRVHAELRLGLGIACGRKRIARLMKAAGLVGVCRRRKRCRSKPLPAPHEDLVRRRFVAVEPNRLWVSDITEHPTSEGKVYCAAVVDVFSRMVVGGSIADHVRAELVVDALEMACWRRRPQPGTIVHADRGAQAVHLVDLRASFADGWSTGFDGPGRFQRRQRVDGKFLVHDAARVVGPPVVVHESGTGDGDVRVDRGVLQPPPTPLRHRLPQPC